MTEADRFVRFWYIRMSVYNLQINSASNDIAETRKLPLKEEIYASDFRSIKAENEKKISALKAKLIEISETTTNIQPVLEKAGGVLLKIGELYKEWGRKDKEIDHWFNLSRKTHF